MAIGRQGFSERQGFPVRHTVRGHGPQGFPLSLLKPLHPMPRHHTLSSSNQQSTLFAYQNVARFVYRYLCPGQLGPGIEHGQCHVPKKHFSSSRLQQRFSSAAQLRDISDRNWDRTGGDRTGGDRTGGGTVPGGGPYRGGPYRGGPYRGGPYRGDRTGGDRTGGDRTGGDRTGGDRTGGDRTGGDRTGGDRTGGTVPGGTVPGGTVPGGTVPGGTVPGGTVPGGTVPGGTVPGGTVPGGTVPGEKWLVLASEQIDTNSRRSRSRQFNANNLHILLHLGNRLYYKPPKNGLDWNRIKYLTHKDK